MRSLPESGTDVDATLAGSDPAPARTLVALARGDSVGRYTVLDRIGQGAMGIVYAAYDPELDRKVALKLLVNPDGSTVAAGTGRTRFVREAQAMAKLAHANVVAVHDTGTHEGVVFIAMEFVDGSTLAAHMAERSPWPTILPLFLQAGSGLAAAHAAGLVHRDFKPDNVLVTRAGVAKVSDFGLARAVASTEPTEQLSVHEPANVLSTDVTRVGALVGTPAYMAPEQHVRASTDARADQFAFCVALYEALYGERPFRGRTLPEIVYAVTTGEIAEPPAGSAVPSHLRKVVLRGLAVDPDARWPAMDALLAALQHDPSRARRRRLLVGGLGLAFVASAGGLAVHDRAERDGCRRQAEAAGALWNEGTRDETFAAMRATKLPYAETAIERVDALLGAWIDRWAAASERACLAIAREPDDELARLQLECLEEHRIHLEVTVDLLVAADDGVTTAAVPTVAALPRVDACADESSLRRRAASRDAVSDPQTALDVTRLVALTRSHQPERALALATKLLQTTRDHPFLAAEVLYTLARIGEHDATETTRKLEEAYFTAGTHGNHRVAALTAIDLTMHTGTRVGDLEQGRSWASHATMMVDRDPQPELRHELLYAVGALESTAGNLAAAIEAFREQADIARNIYGEDHPEMGYAYNALGNAHSSADNLAEAREYYERARAVWQRALGADHPSTIMISFNVANVAARDGRFPEALYLHREVLAARERVLRPGDIAFAESYGAIGETLQCMNDHAAALVEHRRALAMYETTYGGEAPRTVVELHRVIVNLIELGRLDEARPLVERGCALAEPQREENPDGWIRCNTGRGELALSSGGAAEAARLFEANVAAAERLHGTNHLETREARARWARALLAVGEARQARVQLERVVADWQTALGHPRLRDVLADLAEAAVRTGDPALAVRSCERALELARAHGGSPAEIEQRTAMLARMRDPAN